MRTLREIVHLAELAAVAMLIVSPALLAQERPASADVSWTLDNAFRQNSAVLLPAATADLDGMARAIRARPNATWEIGGYTNSVGKASRNLQVSQQRADAVKAYLVSKGVPAASLTAVGYGARHPVASNRTAAGRARNMRVEIKRLPGVRQVTETQPAVAAAAASVAPTAAVGPAKASALPEGAMRQNSTAAASPAGSAAPLPVAVTPAPARVDAVAKPTAVAAAAAPRPAAREGGALGFGVGYASFSTSYWFYGGGNSRWQSWAQFQASGFFEGRAPLRIGPLQTRYRLELRVGTGGADNAVGAGYVGNGASLTNGSLSGGVAATLRLPLTASTGTQPKPFVGLGVDYSFLWGFGDKSGSIYGEGWNERILTFPLVAGVNLYTARLMIRPEIRYAFLGSASSNLYLPGAGPAWPNTVPKMKGIFVSVSWR